MALVGNSTNNTCSYELSKKQCKNDKISVVEPIPWSYVGNFVFSTFVKLWTTSAAFSIFSSYGFVMKSKSVHL